MTIILPQPTKLHTYATPLPMDIIFVIDSFRERAEQIYDTLKSIKSVRSVQRIDRYTEVERQSFRTMIESLLRANKNIGIVSNFYRMSALQDVQCTEDHIRTVSEHPERVGTRKFIVSCRGSSAIRAKCEEEGIRRPEIRHVKYDADNPRLSLDNLEHLILH